MIKGRGDELMKKLLPLFFIFISVPIAAQEPTDDPLADSYIIQAGGGNELVGINGSEVAIYKYFEKLTLFDRDSLVMTLNYNTSGEINDVCIDDFDHDQLSEIALAMESNGQAKWMLLKADENLLSIDTLARWAKTVEGTVSGPAIYSPPEWGLISPVLIKSGNLDSDAQQEFIVAYWAQDQDGGGTVRILAYDVSDSLNVTYMGEIMDQKVTIPPKINLCEDQLLMFDIECADFNGDGIAEILLTGRNGVGENGWEIFADIYSWDSSASQIVLKSNATLYSREDNTYDMGNFNVAAGHFISADKDNGVVSFLQYLPDVYGTGASEDTISNILIPFGVNADLDLITVGEPVIQQHDTLATECWYDRFSTLVCLDVNNDDLDEVISTFSMTDYSNPVANTFRIYKGTAPLGLDVWADIKGLNRPVGMVTIGNVKLESETSEPFMEVVIPVNLWPDYHSELYQIQYDEAGNFEQFEFLDQMTEIFIYNKSEPLQTGEFDADIRLGKPNRYSITSILQPLVILNAPPIHFDVLNGESYDVSLSYNGNESKFISHYQKESSQATEVTSEFTQDWGLSQTLKAGGSYWGISVSSHLTTKYGKRFSESGGYSTKVTVSIAVDAREDDRIYATVVDYDLWEYPVYGNLGSKYELRGYVMVVRPKVVENRWFPSKSWSGYSYIPSHEVGNILSYREYPVLSDNPEVDEKIKGDYNNSFVLDANSSYDWALQFEDFATNQASTSKSYSREWGVDVDVWGSGYSLSGSYSREEIYTHKTEVANGLGLSVHLDGIDMGLGEVGYIVTPYAYWATNGALVVDYAVKPELAPPGGTSTWWQVHYGDLADPAFILPWRYDPEKGFALEDPAKRTQTKDLIFLPSDPKEGETILIRARVHNFSLIPTPGPMSVRFYVGDPDSGGTLITGTGGEDRVYTESAIPARGSTTVDMSWKIPNGLGTYPRIYAVIDADNSLPEIHENNNKSWAILEKSTSTALPSDADPDIPLNFSLRQNYPNPFNPVTKIEFIIPVAQKVSLAIYNVLGERIVSVVDGNLPAGRHAYRFNGRDLSSGVYFYRLEAGNFVETRKMILLR